VAERVELTHDLGEAPTAAPGPMHQNGSRYRRECPNPGPSGPGGSCATSTAVVSPTATRATIAFGIAIQSLSVESRRPPGPLGNSYAHFLSRGAQMKCAVPRAQKPACANGTPEVAHRYPPGAESVWAPIAPAWGF
jgi:hypothetical protein